MAHGTPATGADIAPFYTSIRRGRPPTAELLDELVARYGAIGGTSPLAELTRAQVAGIAAALDRAEPGGFLVRFGAKHTEPSIETGLHELVDAGVGRVVALVLTPHESTLGSGEYLRRAREAAGVARPTVEVTAVPSWHRAPGFAELLAARTDEAIASLGPGAEPHVLFTAHSLPVRAVPPGDPYPREVAESAADVAGLTGLGDLSARWGVAWQSAGRTADPWLGPDLLGEIGRLGASGTRSIVVCPVGFVADHLEVLYDLDVEARRAADAAGIALARTRSLNDDPQFVAILAGVVRAAAGGAARSSSTAGERAT